MGEEAQEEFVAETLLCNHQLHMEVCEAE